LISKYIKTIAKHRTQCATLAEYVYKGPNDNVSKASIASNPNRFDLIDIPSHYINKDESMIQHISVFKLWKTLNFCMKHGREEAGISSDIAEVYEHSPPMVIGFKPTKIRPSPWTREFF